MREVKNCGLCWRERERERDRYTRRPCVVVLLSLSAELRKSITPLLLLEFSKNVGKSTSEADILVWRYLFPSMLLPPPEFRKFGVRTDDVPPPPPNALVVPHEFNVVRIRRTTSPAAKMSHSFPDTATSPPTGMGNISAIRLGEMEFRVDEEQRRGGDFYDFEARSGGGAVENGFQREEKRAEGSPRIEPR